MVRDHTDGVVEQLAVDATEDHHQVTEMEADTVNCACLGNLDDVEDKQVLQTANCYDEEETFDLCEDPEVEVDESLVGVTAAEQHVLPADAVCSEDDDDEDDNTVDVMEEQFYDADSTEQAGRSDNDGCCDTVSDSVSFDAANGDDVTMEELPESRSDSMLSRLPMRLDVLPELPDSGAEDVTDHSAGHDPHLLAVSPHSSTPTSPAAVFDHMPPERNGSVSSPDGASKPPPGAVVMRKSSSAKSESAERSPSSPTFQGCKVEMRPPKPASATKRVTSFRKSLSNFKYVSL